MLDLGHIVISFLLTRKCVFIDMTYYFLNATLCGLFSNIIHVCVCGHNIYGIVYRDKLLILFS